MLRPGESPEELQQRLDREHARFRRKLRRQNWSLLALSSYLFVHVGWLPFTSSLEQILLATGILLILWGQFVFVTGMD